MNHTVPEPIIPKVLETIGSLTFSNGLELQAKRIFEVKVSGINANAVSFEGVVLDACEISSSKLRKVWLLDAIFSKCLLFGTDFDESGMQRVKFDGGILSGVVMTGSVIKQVLFRNLKLDLSNFRFAHLTNVLFVGCDMSEVDFQEAELKKVEFVDCNLARADFSKCTMQNVDLRGAILTDIKGVSSLKGATISLTQLIGLSRDLAADIGMVVEDS